MIIFDCERLKHPNTGLYHYTLNLSEALADEAIDRDDKRLMFYAPKDKADLLDPRIPVKRVGVFDRALLYDPRVKLWHTTSQLSRYQPKGCKKVLTIHDLNFLYEPLTDGQKRRRLDIVKRNLRGVEAIIAISEFTKADIERNLDLGGLPIEVIYNGCNHYYGPLEKPIDAPVKPFLFAVGTVVPKKNFHVLPALLVDNDYDLVVAGSIDREDYQKKILDEARRWGVADRVRVTGPISESVKHWYFKNCDAFLHPSIAEGFGLPVIEAMNYGKPVFISDHTSLPEVGGKVAYYFNHEFDPDGMRSEFHAGMEDFNSGKVTPADLMNHAKKFSWAEAARRHFDLYNEILDLSRR